MGLADTVHDGAEDGLKAVVDRVVSKTRANLPVGDPADDPNPEFALAEHVVVHVDGDGFIIEVEGPYAARQHEQISLEHPRGGGPKFLERALTDVVAEAPEIVASHVRARLARGLHRPL